jgi:hypothetical protein
LSKDQKLAPILVFYFVVVQKAKKEFWPVWSVQWGALAGSLLIFRLCIRPHCLLNCRSQKAAAITVMRRVTPNIICGWHYKNNPQIL